MLRSRRVGVKSQPSQISERPAAPQPISHISPWWAALEAVIPKQHRRLVYLRDTLADLKAGGNSTHSRLGWTLPYLITELEKAGIPYQLRAFPGKGYLLQGMPEMKENEGD